MAMHTTIETLWKKGMNKSQIAAAINHDWKTVNKVIKAIEAGEQLPIKKPHPKKLDPYQEQIIQWIEQDLSGLRIYEKLVDDFEINISYSAVKNYISTIKSKKETVIRFHSEPGEEAQVDFGYVGFVTDNKGKKRKGWVFNMRLSYSRLDYYEVVFDQKVETFIKCHINAFDYFGGTPEYVKIDNLKSAILNANFYESVYQTLYKNFADYYGFNPLPCRVRKPQEKGKTESGIKYIKNNFFAGRTFQNKKDLDLKLNNWLKEYCNSRIHGTTRKVPYQLFEQVEQNKLMPLPDQTFKLTQVGARKVYTDCHVYINYNYYSVPFEYVGSLVNIELCDNLVKIYYQNKLIATHPKLRDKGEFSTIGSHYPKFKRYLSTEYQEIYQVKMREIGCFAEQIFFNIVDKQPRDWNRFVQGIISLQKTYNSNIIDLACKRALAFNVYQYSVIKNICKNGLYKLPVDFSWKGDAYAFSKN